VNSRSPGSLSNATLAVVLGEVSSATSGFLTLESLKGETSGKEFLLGGSSEVDCLHLFVSLNLTLLV